MDDDAAHGARERATDPIERSELRRFEAGFSGATDQGDDEESSREHDEPHQAVGDARIEIAKDVRNIGTQAWRECARDGDGCDQPEQPHDLPPESAQRAEHEEHHDECEADEIDPWQARWNGGRDRCMEHDFHGGEHEDLACGSSLDDSAGDTAHRWAHRNGGFEPLEDRAKLASLTATLMISTQETIDRAFDQFRQMIEQDPILRAEHAASASKFFSSRDAGSDEVSRAARSRRHLEWFLLERVSPRSRVPSIMSLIERLEEDVVGLDPDLVPVFLGSHASVFEVTGVDQGQGVWLRDLANLGEYPVVEPDASNILQKGDMIAGRIFPIGDSLYHVSRASAFFRGSTLLSALRNDLQRAREGRRGLLRLAQSEIERMFFGPSAAPEPIDALDTARGMLLNGGVEEEDIRAIFEQLASEPFENGQVLPGARDILGVILDRLAFETAIDLEVARRTLLHAWAQLSRSGPGSGPSLQPARLESRRETRDVAQVIAEFELKRSSGKPLEELFQELEDHLALDGTPSTLDEDDTPAPDFPGVVGAMIEEFLWEIEHEEGPAATRELESLRSFGRFAINIGVFENLRARDLLTYTAYWLPESDELANADAARKLLSALQKFCRWSEDLHEVPLLTEFRPTLQALQSSLPRVIEANRRRTRETDRAQGELFECVDVAPSGHVRTIDRAGRVHEAELDPLLATWLRAGDRVRGRRLDDDRLAVYCCYPPEARALSEA